MSSATSKPSETATRLTALCQRLWRPEQDETEMIAAFAEIAPAVEAALTPAAFNLIYHSRHHQQFFEKHLFDCTAEYSCSEAEREQKLAILRGLGIGRHGATVALVHWITGISTQKCSDLLAQASGPLANMEQEFAEQLAELAAACPVRPASFDPQIKLSALALLPRISRSSGALLFLCHCTDPTRETNPEVRCAAIQSLGKHTEILSLEEPLSPAWLAQLWRLSVGGSLTEKELRQRNARLVLGSLIRALNDPDERVFDATLSLARMVFSPSAWGGFVSHLSQEGIVGLCEKLAATIRAGGLRTDKVLAMLSDPELQHLHLYRSGPLEAFRKAVPSADASPAFKGIWDGLVKLLHALHGHIGDQQSDFDESIAAINALVQICNHPSWIKFLCDTLLSFSDQGKISTIGQQLTHEVLENFARAIDPSYYQQFPCKGGSSCTVSYIDGNNAYIGEPTRYYNIEQYNYIVSDSHLKNNCSSKSSSAHVSDEFPAKRCPKLLTSRFTYTAGGASSFRSGARPNIFPASAHLRINPKAIILNDAAKATLNMLLTSQHSAYWREDVGSENWAILEEINTRGITLEMAIREFETSYKKRFRAGGPGPREYFEVLKSKSTPDRRMVKALLDAMKVLAVGDVAAQEFLVGLFGKDKATFHWHEPTRIWIIETLAVMTCGETMKSGETVYTWLSSIAGVEDSPAVNEATKKARQDIRGKNLSSANTEMLLAPLANQPADAFGLRA